MFIEMFINFALKLKPEIRSFSNLEDMQFILRETIPSYKHKKLIWKCIKSLYMHILEEAKN